MDTYAQTYYKVYEKCRKARDAGKSHIEIRPWRDSYRLYAHSRYMGYDCIAWRNRAAGITEWADTITQRIAHKKYCKPKKEDN